MFQKKNSFKGVPICIKEWFPRPINARYEFLLGLAKWFKKRYLKIIGHIYPIDGQTTPVVLVFIKLLSIAVSFSN